MDRISVNCSPDKVEGGLETATSLLYYWIRIKVLQRWDLGG